MKRLLIAFFVIVVIGAAGWFGFQRLQDRRAALDEQPKLRNRNSRARVDQQYRQRNRQHRTRSPARPLISRQPAA